MESQHARISNYLETKGFDFSTGNTWIYPDNFPVREYQYNIVKSALYHNTLICLPTGLGKTFIAAVVMYNFWRWYPFGKIIFVAPTKPLIAQQIDACYKVMGIPSADMVELTGAVTPKNREIAWLKKRIIFTTPHIFYNDLERTTIQSHLIKCVVIDEAHRALDKHIYCKVIRNLNISNLELRDENLMNIMPYVNKRKVDIILVPLSNELAQFKEKYITIMDRHVKFLIQCNILQDHTAKISKERIFCLLKKFEIKTNKSRNYPQVMKTLSILFTMYHAYELMIRHGLRAFWSFYKTHSDKYGISSEYQLRDLLCDIEVYLGPFPKLFPNGLVDEMPKNIVFGHNKFHKLKELLERHFNNNDQKDTRAIVFVEYRDIVNEVYILLLQSKPTIRPQMFIGQAGQKQKQQLKALEDFRSNRVNVLISTSIGEEGLDVGEVDLIICFDVSQDSLIRLVQRMDRTRRKRDGHIITLVTDEKEHENLKSTLSKRDSLNNKILNTSNISFSLYDNNPRMIPNEFTPECHKIHITVLPKTPSIKKNKEKRKNVNEKNETSNMKQKENLSKEVNTDQPTMINLLSDNKCNEQNEGNACNIIQLTTQNNRKHNTINPNKVKLLTDDNAGIEFLTLCAVKKSEESENNFIYNANNYINHDINKFSYTVQDEKNFNNDEIRFKDILDKNSDSNKISISYLNQQVTNIKDINTHKASTSDMKKDNEIITCTKAELSTNSLKNLERTLFETIWNESYSSIETDFEDKNDTALRNTESPNLLNSFTRNIEEVNVTHNINVIDTFPNDDCAARTNQNLSALEKFAKPEINKLTSSIDKIRDCDFNSDDDINEFKDQTNKNKLLYNSNAEESLLSRTQAIGEIARVKKKSLKRADNEESIDYSVGWNLVYKKSKVQVGKSETSSRTDNITLSNIHCDSVVKTCTPKQNFNFLDDSDEDVITENSSEKDIRCVPSTSTKSKVENYPFDDLIKSLKPCSISPKNNKNSKWILSLKDKNARNTTRKNKCKENVKNQFIDDEAVADSDASSDEFVDTNDEDIADFVSYIEIPHDRDIHAHYLQTTKSPVIKPGAFHFRKQQSPDSNIEICSQVSSQDQNSYLYDSFCVVEDDDLNTSSHSDSILDKMERELEENRRKRLCADKDVKHTKKKRRRIVNRFISEEEITAGTSDEDKEFAKILE
ncbi:Fanconi anemia group M protein-like isoform X2 [Cardiocondyla obscurior]|uniref:Fanconi anemia group M protein-like isoform X2 n=1 Tax=Cardiocondyla obscurior TaxID=286306 RepID=UPI0039657BB8